MKLENLQTEKTDINVAEEHRGRDTHQTENINEKNCQALWFLRKREKRKKEEVFNILVASKTVKPLCGIDESKK